MSTIQVLGLSHIPAPASFPRLPAVEAPSEPICAGSTCGLPLNKRRDGQNRLVYDSVSVGGVLFHSMKCMTEQQKVQYQQEMKSTREQRERDQQARDAQIREERIERATQSLCLLKSESGPVQCEALGIPYAIALQNAEAMLAHLQGHGPAPKLQFAESNVTTNARAGKTIRT